MLFCMQTWGLMERKHWFEVMRSASRRGGAYHCPSAEARCNCHHHKDKSYLLSARGPSQDLPQPSPWNRAAVAFTIVRIAYLMDAHDGLTAMPMSG
ncbi:MAG: hypothetical protein ACYDGY_09690 [Acidimicrobiales bacterium]